MRTKVFFLTKKANKKIVKEMAKMIKENETEKYKNDKTMNTHNESK